MRSRPVAGGGSAVEVPPDRLEGWFERFGTRHGDVRQTTLSPELIEVTGEDGATARIEVPYGGLPVTARTVPGLALRPLLDHLARPRRIGLILVRLGAHSVGIAEGGRVVRSATDRHLVHGRSAAGGWSQQRFARRRQGQARQALAAAAADAVRVLLPQVAELDAVVLGGDRQALAALRADRRLAPLMALATGRVLDIGQPRRSILDEAAARATAVEVVVHEP